MNASTQDGLEVPELPSFDLFSTALRADAFPMVKEAHASCPIFVDRKLGAWVLTKYADVDLALRDSKTFSSEGINYLIPTPANLVESVPDLCSDNFTSVMAMDPPDHGPERLPMQRALSRRIVDGIAPYAREVANELIDSFIARGECDLVNDFAYPFSGRAIAAVLGLPGDDVEQYRVWFRDFGKLFVAHPPDTTNGVPPDRGLSSDQIDEMWREVGKANALFRGYVADRQANPSDDFISMMLAMTDKDGQPFNSVGDIIRSVMTLLGGGQDTTANLIANIAILLTENADQKQLLLDDFRFLPHVVEEGVRRKGSALGLVRRATCDVELRGVRIPAGAIVYLSLQGANLDPEVFEEPERFDIMRANASKHLAFGLGRHACTGQPLARLETEIALDVLYRRIPGLKVDLARERSFGANFTASVLETLPAHW